MSINDHIEALEGWEVMFDKEFDFSMRYGVSRFLKDFIRTHFISKRELLSKLEGMKLPTEAGKCEIDYREERRRTSELTGYNQALEDIKKLL